MKYDRTDLNEDMFDATIWTGEESKKEEDKATVHDGSCIPGSTIPEGSQFMTDHSRTNCSRVNWFCALPEFARSREATILGGHPMVAR